MQQGLPVRFRIGLAGLVNAPGSVDGGIDPRDLAHRGHGFALAARREGIFGDIVDLHVARIDLLEIAHADGQLAAVPFDFVEAGRRGASALR